MCVVVFVNALHRPIVRIIIMFKKKYFINIAVIWGPRGRKKKNFVGGSAAGDPSILILI